MHLLTVHRLSECEVFRYIWREGEGGRRRERDIKEGRERFREDTERDRDGDKGEERI